MKRFLLLLTFVLLSADSGRLLAADLTPSQLDFFESKIRPILVDNCYKCHSATADKIKGGLLLDTRDALLQGGDSGKAIVPGDPEASLLLRRMVAKQWNKLCCPSGI